MSLSRSVSTIYCDDIRREVGEKVSFMGVYGSSLIVTEFPATLPKLCIIISVITPANKPFEELCIRVFLESEIVGQIEFDGDQLSEMLSSIDNNNEAEDGALHMRAVLTISPLVISASSKIRVRVITESEELKGLALNIEPAATAI